MDAAFQREHPGWTVLASAVLIGGVLVVLDAIDFSRDPATDTADVVATVAVFGGAVVWFVARRLEATRPELANLKLIGSIAAGVALGALVIGLLSVAYDPFAN